MSHSRGNFCCCLLGLLPSLWYYRCTKKKRSSGINNNRATTTANKVDHEDRYDDGDWYCQPPVTAPTDTTAAAAPQQHLARGRRRRRRRRRLTATAMLTAPAPSVAGRQVRRVCFCYLCCHCCFSPATVSSNGVYSNCYINGLLRLLMIVRVRICTMTTSEDQQNKGVNKHRCIYSETLVSHEAIAVGGCGRRESSNRKSECRRAMSGSETSNLSA